MLNDSVGILVMIICYVLGTGLMILEAFMPGFGVAGVSGLILEIAAIVLTHTHFGLLWSLLATFLVVLVVGTVVFLSYRSAMNGRLSRSALILKDSETADSSTPAARTDWVNREGTAVTALRPAGFIEIDGTRLSASTSGEFLSRGTAVQVVGAQGDHLLIRKK